MNKIKTLVKMADEKVTEIVVVGKANVKEAVKASAQNPREAFNIWGFAIAVASLVVIAVMLTVIIGSGSSDSTSLIGKFTSGVSNIINKMFNKSDSAIL